MRNRTNREPLALGGFTRFRAPKVALRQERHRPGNGSQGHGAEEARGRGGGARTAPMILPARAIPSGGVMVYQETFVQRNQHRIYVREYPGEEPTIILMHGFPDNQHLYDRLTP